MRLWAQMCTLCRPARSLEMSETSALVKLGLSLHCTNLLTNSCSQMVGLTCTPSWNSILWQHCFNMLPGVQMHLCDAQVQSMAFCQA